MITHQPITQFTEDGREERATATEISQFTEVAAAATVAATVRLAGNGLAFRTIYFPSSASFFRFPSYEMLGFFCYLLRFLYPLGVPNGAVLFEYLVHGFECLIREFLFWRFFLLFCFSFWVTEFASIFASNGYNTRVAMSFHKFG